MVKRKRKDSSPASDASTPRPCHETGTPIAQRKSQRKQSIVGASTPTRASRRGPVESKAPSQPTDTASRSLRSRTIPKEQPPFRFLDLPPELRNNVYEQYFSSSTTTMASRAPANEEGKATRYWLFNHKGYGAWAAWDGSPPLLSACKQVRKEASTIYDESTEYTVKSSIPGIPYVIDDFLVKLSGHLTAVPKRICWSVPYGRLSEDDLFAAARYQEYLERLVTINTPTIDVKYARVEVVDKSGTVVWPTDTDDDAEIEREGDSDSDFEDSDVESDGSGDEWS